MRNFVKPLLNSLLVLLFFLAVKPIYGAAEQSVQSLILPQPNAELQPGDVVQIVIDALAINDFPFRDAGIETTFNFASPSNKLQTGPLQNFTKLLKGPAYSQMLNHRDSTLSEVILDDNKAIRLVQIISENNQTLYFAFRLGLQQQGNYSGMWLTEAVWQMDNPSGDVVAL
jgi:hypothetical protein